MRQRSEVSYLAALSLALSVIEASLPHALPFLRLGLANLSLLWALTRLCAKDYFILALIKWLLSSFIAGTLFSPYSLVSFAGNASSSIVMLILFRYCSRLFSLYAVSASGSVISAVFQLLSASLFLSSSVLSLIPVMMIFNLFTGLVLAFIAYHISPASDVKISREKPFTEKKRNESRTVLVFSLAALVSLLFTYSIPVLALQFISALVLCFISGRRIRPLFYVISFISVVIFNLFTPSGRLVFAFVTEGALAEGVMKALRLTATVALSQSMSTLPLTSGGMASEIMSVYAAINERFFSAEGKTAERLKEALKLDAFTSASGGTDDVHHLPFIAADTLIVILAVVSLTIMQS